jgi:hypothetical protein
MPQKNEVRQQSNCPITVETTIALVNGSNENMPSQKRKEDAKQVLYLNRI